MIQPPEKEEVVKTAAQIAAAEAAKAVSQRETRRERFANTANKVLYLLLPVLVVIIVMLVLQNNYTGGRATLNNERFEKLQQSIDAANRKLDRLNTSD